MILETIVSTLNLLGKVNFAPMGVELSDCATPTTAILRPFTNTHTFYNLRDTPFGVINFTGDVYAMARCALDEYEPPWLKGARTGVPYMVNASSHMEFKVKTISDTDVRAAVNVEFLETRRLPCSIGLNRAVFAVLETLILATRLSLYERSKVEAIMNHYAQIVEKTGGEQEKTAMDFVDRWIRSHW